MVFGLEEAVEEVVGLIFLKLDVILFLSRIK